MLTPSNSQSYMVCSSRLTTQTKDLHSRYERVLQESEAALEKLKSRHDVAAEDLQRFLLSKEGESAKEAGMPSSTNSKANKRALGKAVAKGNFLLKGRSPANVFYPALVVTCCSAFDYFPCVIASKARRGYTSQSSRSI